MNERVTSFNESFEELNSVTNYIIDMIKIKHLIKFYIENGFEDDNEILELIIWNKLEPLF